MDLLGEALDLKEPLERSWQQNQELGPLQRLMTAIREVVLPSLSAGEDGTAAALPPELPSPRDPQEKSSRAEPPSSRVRLVIFLDEIDIVRSLDFSVDGFFAAIRECYNRRAQDPAYESLAFCLLGVATPTDLIRDARRTPFNIGRRIELNDFTAEEADALVPGLVTENVHGAVSRLLLARIHHWTGGHPYLTQRLCQETADVLRNGSAQGLGGGGTTTDRVKRLIDPLCTDLFLSNHALRRDPNLSFVSEHLLRSELERTSLLDLYRKVRSGHHVPDDELDSLANQLKLAGIVRTSAGRLVVRNRIYARAFNPEWVRANMPAAELRRQREAFRRGVVLSTVVSLFIIAIMAGLTAIAIQARNSERMSSARAYFSEARAQRMSGRSGQRIASLAALDSARRHYTNRAQMREEATAALTLMDLQKRPDWSSDRAGKITAISTDLSVAAHAEVDGSITFFSPTDGTVLSRIPKLNPKPRRLHFSPKGNFLLVDHDAGAEGRLTVWSRTKPQQLFPALDHGIMGRAFDFTADETKLAVGRKDGTIEIYSLPSGDRGQPLHFDVPAGILRVPDVVRFNPSGELLAVSSRDDTLVEIRSVSTGQRVAEDIFHAGSVNDVAWGEDGRYLGSACADDLVHVVNTDGVSPRRTLKGHSDDVLRLAFSHNGSLISSFGQDGTIRLWSLASEEQLLIHAHESLEEISFSANDRHLICSAAGQRKLDLLEVIGGEYVTLRAERGRLEPRNTLDFSGDGRHLLAALSGRLTLFDLAVLRETGPLPVTKPHGAYFSPDSQQVLVSTDLGLFQCPVDTTPPDRTPLHPHLEELTTITLAPDRQRAAVVQLDRILVFDTASLSLIQSHIVGRHYDHLALGPRGHWLAGMVKGSGTLELWNLEQGPDTPSTVLPASEHFTFDPSGRWLILSRAGGFQLLDVGTWKEHKPPAVPSDEAAGVGGPIAVNIRGTMLAVASSHYAIELWRIPRNDEPSELELITTLRAGNHLETLTFSPDGVWLGAITKFSKGAPIELWNLQELLRGLTPYLEKRPDFY
jgi:WD40 repeat protein